MSEKALDRLVKQTFYNKYSKTEYTLEYYTIIEDIAYIFYGFSRIYKSNYIKVTSNKKVYQFNDKTFNTLKEAYEYYKTTTSISYTYHQFRSKMKDLGYITLDAGVTI